MEETKKDDTEQSGNDSAVEESTTGRDLSKVANDLRNCVREINAKVKRIEKSQNITQDVLDLEFTI